MFTSFFVTLDWKTDGVSPLRVRREANRACMPVDVKPVICTTLFVSTVQSRRVNALERSIEDASQELKFTVMCN